MDWFKGKFTGKPWDQGGRHVQSSMIHFDIAEVPAPRQKSIGGHWQNLGRSKTLRQVPLDASSGSS